mmetsp:Transcript_9709/g.14331  ORF Transcript_9709/g.14331 Transcript_9709/m.14331 type:complete len:233 (+) Transcript_9709:2-700(+)
MKEINVVERRQGNIRKHLNGILNEYTEIQEELEETHNNLRTWKRKAKHLLQENNINNRKIREFLLELCDMDENKPKQASLDLNTMSSWQPPKHDCLRRKTHQEPISIETPPSSIVKRIKRKKRLSIYERSHASLIKPTIILESQDLSSDDDEASPPPNSKETVSPIAEPKEMTMTQRLLQLKDIYSSPKKKEYIHLKKKRKKPKRSKTPDHYWDLEPQNVFLGEEKSNSIVL